MGTNYYLERDVCPKCGRGDEPIHIGKSSVGWCFALAIYPDDGIHDIADWVPLFRDGYIKDEYGDSVDSGKMVDIIIGRGFPDREWSDGWWKSQFGRYISEQDFHDRNHSQRGPNGLLRARIGDFCVKHGDGPWDCMRGEFS